MPELTHSPLPLLVVVTGEPGAGKTTLCSAAAERAARHGLTVCGLLSLPYEPPPDSQSGSTCDSQSEGTWRKVLDLASGDSRLLARLRNPRSDAPRSDGASRSDHSPTLQSRAGGSSQAAGPQSLAWVFDQIAIDWANECLEKCVTIQPDVLIVDEIGPLEILRGEGWHSALPLVARARYRMGIVVVRPSLLAAFDDAVGAAAAETGDGPGAGGAREAAAAETSSGGSVSFARLIISLRPDPASRSAAAERLLEMIDELALDRNPPAPATLPGGE